MDAGADVGPRISFEHRDRVHGFVIRAVAEGAEVLAGGAPLERDGAYYPPTLAMGAPQHSGIVEGEARAIRVSHQLDVGVTWVDDHLPIASEAPHGGVKRSGFGKDMSIEPLLDYSVTRHLMIRHAAPPETTGYRPA